MAQTVKVTILGSEYPLRSNDEDLTLQLAQDVDGYLSELQTKLPAQSTTTLAVLGALNFAEQEVHTKENERREIDRIAHDLETLAATLEQAME
jgi:cell division protein ZapA (FtsZ GTPase activity inhibitor)